MKRHPSSIGAAGSHHYSVRVYYEDTDAGGVVYHGNYLRYAERARTEALRAAGIPHAEMVRQHGVMFVVRHVEVEYLRPARVDDWLDVTTEPFLVGGASVHLRQRILRDGQTMVEVQLRLACVAVTDGRPARLPERWRLALDRQIRAEAAAAAVSDDGAA